jgi:pyridoxine/pyridoxamine 5'-phosphate oxidase
MSVVTTEENIDLYGSPDIAWKDVAEQLDAGRVHRFWLATVDADGRPHLNGIGARWVDGVLFFKSGARTRKSGNLERDGRCVISAELPDFDVTFDGRAVRVTDEATVQRLAEVWASSGWPARAKGSQLEADYSAPTAGPPPWDLWMLAPASAIGLGAGGAMRWHFAPPRA